MELLVIRHAQSSGQAPEAVLTPEGQAQAEALGKTLSAYDPSHLFSSPYVRAVATLAPYAARYSVDISVIDEFRERQLSDAPLPDWQDHIARSFDDPDHAAPGGESHGVLLARIHHGLAQIAAQAPSRPVVATHGGVISCLFHSLDPDFGFEAWQALRNPQLFLVTLADGVPTGFRDFLV